MMLQTEIGIHLLEPAVFILNFMWSFQVRGFHTAVFNFPLIEGTLAESILTAQRMIMLENSTFD